MSIFGKIFRFKNQDRLVEITKSATSKEFKKIVNDRLFSCLKEYGFKRKGNNFKKEDLELDYFIQIQSSSSSTSQLVKLTINLGIDSKLLRAKELELKLFSGDHHWRERISYFMDNKNDYWWIIDSNEKAENVSNEIVEIIEKRVIKEWTNIKTTLDLKRILEIKKYFGLTIEQKDLLIKLISNE